MPLKYSAAQSSYAKVLIDVVLVAWSATSAATAESTRDGNISSSHVFNTPAHTRRLRSDADVTTNNSTNTFEERTKFSFPKLDALKEAFFSPIRVHKWQADINDKYDHLARHATENNDPVTSLDFFYLEKWNEFANSKHPDSRADAIKSMFWTLAHRFDTNTLVRILVAGTKSKKTDSTQTIATELLDVQVKKWVYERQSVFKVFEYLQLEKTIDDLFKNPLVWKWVAFAESIYSREMAVAMMVTALVRFKKDIAAVDEIIAKGVKAPVPNSIAKEMDEPTTNTIPHETLQFLKHRNGARIAAKAIADTKNEK